MTAANPLAKFGSLPGGGTKNKWPVAYKVAKAYQIDTADLNELSGEVDLQGKSIEDVAAAWITANEATWRAWAQ